MRVLHVIDGIGREGGGPSRSSQGLVAGLCNAGVDAWIYSFDHADPWLPGVRRFKQLISVQELKHFDLVHIHGIWSIDLHNVAVMCRKAGVPYVIAPRGMLEPWSLKQKWLKKRVARFLYQDRDLKLATALHATAESEAEQFRRLGFRSKIIISPNGVNVPDCALSTKHQTLCTDEKRRVLFVSRMHPKKGVMELVESWARVKPKNWQCELVYTMNSDEERAYEQKVKQRVREFGLDDQFMFTGALNDEKKWEAYGRADLFVLPTYSENFGIVVVEALWAGVPVITTKGTPWKELVERKCGWWIDLPEKKVEVKGQGLQWTALDFVLREAFEHSDNSNTRTILQEMGRRGHELVENRYTWSAVCDKMVRGYEEVLNGRA